MRRTVIWGALALASAGAGAQERAGAPPFPAASPTAPSDAPTAAPTFAPEVSLAERDERLTVPVSVAGAGPYPFLIDTGSQRTVISRELAQTLGLPPGRVVQVTAMSGVGSSRTVMIPSISVTPGGIAGAQIEAPALAAADIGAPGLLGIDTLQDRRVAIDLDRRVMSVEPSTRRRRREPDTAGEVVVRARSLFGQLVVTDAYANGVRVRVVLDTGSAASVGNMALRRKLREGRDPVKRVALLSVLGGRLDADYTVMPRVTIGDLAIQALPVAYADAAPFKRLGLDDKPALLLGMDALALFRRVEIDFPNRQVRLLLPRALAAQRERERSWRPPG